MPVGCAARMCGFEAVVEDAWWGLEVVVAAGLSRLRFMEGERARRAAREWRVDSGGGLVYFELNVTRERSWNVIRFFLILAVLAMVCEERFALCWWFCGRYSVIVGFESVGALRRSTGYSWGVDLLGASIALTTQKVVVPSTASVAAKLDAEFKSHSRRRAPEASRSTPPPRALSIASTHLFSPHVAYKPDITSFAVYNPSVAALARRLNPRRIPHLPPFIIVADGRLPRKNQHTTHRQR